MRPIFAVTDDYWWALRSVFIVSGFLWAVLISNGRCYHLRKIMASGILPYWQTPCVLVS